MIKRIALVLAPLLGMLALAGCSSRPLEAAPAGAAPAIRTAVGPIPGSAVQPQTVSDPYNGNSVAIAEGRKLFLWYNCAGCHGGHAGGGMGPSLRDPVWLYGSSDAQVFDSIAQGRSKGMPAWGTKVPEQQIWKLVVYIKSLRTPQEPDPPMVPPSEQVPSPVITYPAQAAK
jgi:cytochrome c oxidase cbb3-type subunit 3